jgi:hypothetical protein
MAKMNLALLSADALNTSELKTSNEDIATADQIVASVVGDTSGDVGNLNRIAVEIEQANRGIEEAFDTAQAMESMNGTLGRARYDGIGVESAKTIMLAVEHMRGRLGFRKKTQVSMESLTLGVSKLESLRIAKESIIDTIKAIWQAIMNSIKRVGEWIMGFFGHLFKSKDRQNSSVSKSIQKVDDASQAIKDATPDQKKIIDQLIASEESGTAPNVPGLTPEENTKLKQKLANQDHIAEAGDGVKGPSEGDLDKIIIHRVVDGQLRIKDYPHLCYMGKALTAKQVDMYLPLFKKYSTDVVGNYMTLVNKSNVDKTFALVEEILLNIDQIEPRHISLSNLKWLSYPDNLKNSTHTDMDDGMRQTVGESYLGDYSAVLIAAKNTSDYTDVEKNLGKYDFQFKKQPSRVDLQGEDVLARIHPDSAKKLWTAIQASRKAIDQKDVDHLKQRYDQLFKKVEQLSRDKPDTDPEILRIANGLVKAINSTYVSYVASSERYLVGFTEDLTRYSDACSRKIKTYAKIAKEVKP